MKVLKNSLAKQILFYGFIPTIVVLLFLVVGLSYVNFTSERKAQYDSLKASTQNFALMLQKFNVSTINTVSTMATAQTSGMFGQRQLSSEYAKQILQNHPEFTGVDFGYEPNIDQNDLKFLNLHQDSPLSKGLNKSGRFLPYWHRGLEDKSKIALTALIDMETSQYYQGIKDSYLTSKQKKITITEPYIYQEKLIIEYISPLIIDGKFKGIAGVDRSLKYMAKRYQNLLRETNLDMMILSRDGRVLLSSIPDKFNQYTKKIENTSFKEIKYKVNEFLTFRSKYSGNEYLTYTLKLPISGWTMIVGHNTEIYNAAFKKQVFELSLMVFIVILMISFFVYRILHHTSTRISATVNAANYLAQGETPANYPLNVQGEDEVSELNESFNFLIKRFINIEKNCDNIAVGDYSRPLIPYSSKDKLTHSINSMAKEREKAEALLVTAKEKAEVANQAKNEFVSMVSHELRTPLTSIQGSLGLIKSGVVGVIAEKPTELIQIAHNNCERLIRIINDILDVEKIAAGKISITKKVFNLSEALVQAIEANDSYAKKFQVKFKLETDITEARVFADKERIQQVLDNLLSNAAKFTQKETEIQIRLIEAANKFRVEITDCGNGIDDKFKSQIFKKFSQGNSKDNREKGGTGLGLNISKSIIELHQGNIGFYNNAKVGATFWFELPEKPEDLNTLKILKNTKKVLICEDDYDVAKLISIMLEQSNIKADIAHSAAEVREKLASNSYDAMTLDYILPDLNGDLLLKEIRESYSEEELPIILISGISKGDFDSKFENKNINWLAKPIEHNKLISMVNFALNGKVEEQHILHVEDEGDIATLVAQMLPQDYKLTTVESIAAAKQEINYQKFSLILLDLGLPDGNGVEVIEYLAEQQIDIPVLIFSAQEFDAKEYKNIHHLLKSKSTIEQVVLEVKNKIGSNF